MPLSHHNYPLALLRKTASSLLFAAAAVALFTTDTPLATAQFATSQPPSDPPPENPSLMVDGKITQVTLYRDRALVSREIQIPADFAGDALTVSGLPEQLIPDSVNADSDGNIEVRSVEIIQRKTAVSGRAEVRALEEEIDGLQTEISELEAQGQLLEADLESLEKLVSFAAQKTSDDLNRGTLDAATLMDLDKYLAERREKALANHFELNRQSKALQTTLESKQRALSDLVSGDYRQQTEARVFIDRQPGNAGTLTLHYLVDGCRWVPRYAVRGAIGREAFSIQYSALVSQVSGEDWDSVKLTLSTGSPSVSAAGPVLNSITVLTSQAAQQAAAPIDAKKLNQRFKALRSQQQAVESDYSNRGYKAEDLSRDLQLNTLANQIQQLELSAEVTAAAKLATDADGEVVSQTYVIPQPVSLQSLRQQQLVRIADMELAGNLYHVATPLLSTYAYRQAELTNTEAIGLLGGPADIYLDDRFVGATEIPTTASGQRLVIGFGADPQVRTRRELRAKEDTIRGGNRILQFDYRLVIANFKDTPVDVRLYDRLPTANESRDVNVKLTPPTQPLSTDVVYERVERTRGILRWDLEIPANSHTDKAVDVEYSYQLEFDRSRTLLTQEVEQEEVVDAFGAPAESGVFGGFGGFGGEPSQAPQPPQP